MAVEWTGKTVSELLAEMEADGFRDFVIDGIVSSQVTTILGDPYLGKTYLSIDIARSLLTGDPFLNRETLTTVDRVAYLCTDPGGQFNIARRIARAGIDGGRIVALPFYTPRDRDEWIEYSDIFTRERVGAIVVDNTSDLAEDANSPHEVKAVTDGLRRWSDAGAVIVNIHHRNKAGGYFGSMLWRKWTRAELELKGNPKTSARRLSLVANDGTAAEFSLAFNPGDGPSFTVLSEAAAMSGDDLSDKRRQRSVRWMDDNARIWALLDEGKSYAAVADDLGISKSRVQRAASARQKVA